MTTISAGTLQIGAGGFSGMLLGDVVNNAALVFNSNAAKTFAGVVSGTGSVTKANFNTLVLTGSNAYSGGTTIASGSNSMSATAACPARSGTGTVTNSGELHFNRADTLTVAANITGSGDVFLEEDSGTTILTGNNSYTGSTRV